MAQLRSLWKRLSAQKKKKKNLLGQNEFAKRKKQKEYIYIYIYQIGNFTKKNKKNDFITIFQGLQHAK